MNYYTRWYFEAAPFFAHDPLRFMVCSIYERRGPAYYKHFTICLN